jgi:hypothetical protein
MCIQIIESVFILCFYSGDLKRISFDIHQLARIIVSAKAFI